MGYVQADLKMNFDFEYDIDYSTFNIPIPNPPPLPPPLNISPATAIDTGSNLNIQETTENVVNNNNNNNDEERRSELSSDNMLYFDELMDAEITMTSENNNNNLVDVNVIPEVVEEAINFHFDIVKSWMLDVESRPDTPVIVEEEKESPINLLPTEASFITFFLTSFTSKGAKNQSFSHLVTSLDLDSENYLIENRI